jgi:hypothetical protein
VPREAVEARDWALGRRDIGRVADVSGKKVGEWN